MGKQTLNINIAHYTSYFHDGSILKITHHEKSMTIVMESAEMHEEDIVDDLILSKDDRILGCLHIEGIKNITEDDKETTTKIEMKFPDAEIFRFRLGSNSVKFHILWFTIPANSGVNDYSDLEITADRIWWENLPEITRVYS